MTFPNMHFLNGHSVMAPCQVHIQQTPWDDQACLLLYSHCCDTGLTTFLHNMKRINTSRSWKSLQPSSHW